MSMLCVLSLMLIVVSGAKIIEFKLTSKRKVRIIGAAKIRIGSRPTHIFVFDSKKNLESNMAE
jgi:hypothetical protein